LARHVKVTRLITANATDTLNAYTDYDPSSLNAAAYQGSSLYLYEQLSGDITASGSVAPGTTVYMPFKPNMLTLVNNTQQLSSGNNVKYITDPFGYSYGYSTIQQSYIASGTTVPANKGFNPTYDLWSTRGLTSGTANQTSWVTNWGNN
jgi:hypothetical protein